MEVLLKEEDKKAIEIEVEEYMKEAKANIDFNHPCICDHDKELILNFFKDIKMKDAQACKLRDKAIEIEKFK